MPSISAVIFILVLSAIFPLVGYYLDYKQNKANYIPKKKDKAQK